MVRAWLPNQSASGIIDTNDCFVQSGETLEMVTCLGWFSCFASL